MSLSSGCIRINIILVLLSDMTKITTMADAQAPEGCKIPEHPGCYHHKGRLAMVDAERAPG